MTHQVADRSGSKPAPSHLGTSWGTHNAGPDYWLEPTQDRRPASAPISTRSPAEQAPRPATK